MKKYQIHIIYNADNDSQAAKSFDFALRAIYNQFGLAFPTKTYNVVKDDVSDIYVNRKGRHFAPEMILVFENSDGLWVKDKISIKDAQYLIGRNPFEMDSMDPENYNKRLQAATLEVTMNMLERNGLITAGGRNFGHLNYLVWGLVGLLVVWVLWKIF